MCGRQSVDSAVLSAWACPCVFIMNKLLFDTGNMKLITLIPVSQYNHLTLHDKRFRPCCAVTVWDIRAVNWTYSTCLLSQSILSLCSPKEQSIDVVKCYKQEIIDLLSQSYWFLWHYSWNFIYRIISIQYRCMRITWVVIEGAFSSLHRYAGIPAMMNHDLHNRGKIITALHLLKV